MRNRLLLHAILLFFSGKLWHDFQLRSISRPAADEMIATYPLHWQMWCHRDPSPKGDMKLAGEVTSERLRPYLAAYTGRPGILEGYL